MTTLPDAVAEALRPVVGRIASTEPVGGGCIAHASRLDAERGRFFLKWADGDAGQTFEAEAAGLRALAEADSPLVVPKPIEVADAHDAAPGWLLLDWIEPGSPTAPFWERLGRGLAELHRAPRGDGGYGFERPNVIGRTPQPNGWRDEWPAFFRSQRLAPQIALAREQRRWDDAWTAPVDRLLDRLDEFLPSCPDPSLLHGDLWSGNVLAASDGRACLIDPAVYVGHRETDLAMSELFGGFDARFYAAYREAWPLEEGYEVRREVYNLYHLLNHLNLFGAGYAGRVERVLRRF